MQANSAGDKINNNWDKQMSICFEPHNNLSCQTTNYGYVY